MRTRTRLTILGIVATFVASLLVAPPAVALPLTSPECFTDRGVTRCVRFDVNAGLVQARASIVDVQTDNTNFDVSVTRVALQYTVPGTATWGTASTGSSPGWDTVDDTAATGWVTCDRGYQVRVAADFHWRIVSTGAEGTERVYSLTWDC